MTRGDVITVDGSRWRVLAVGATENGATYLHLSAETAGVAQKNGWRPRQECGWFKDGTLRCTP